MQRTNYNFPTSIRFGEGVIDELSDYLISNDLKKPLIVTDPILETLEVFKNSIAPIKSNVVFSSINKNPIKKNVLDGVDAYSSNNCDSVIGFGGGASMDVARAIALKANHPENDLFDFDDAKGGDKFVVNEIPHFITIPTTSGTGSEVGRSTVISDDVTKEKKILFAPSLMAKKVFVDPTLSLGLPSFVTAATGIDALTHNIEAYLAPGFSPLCDGLALEGIKLVKNSLEKATKDPCVKSRGEMAMAALIGATAFQKGLGVVHSMAHPLSTKFNMHHGLANAICLPTGVRFNDEVVPERIDEIAKIFELDSGRDLSDYLKKYISNLGLPTNLSSQDVAIDDLDHLSELAMNDPCHGTNPRPLTNDLFKKLFKETL
ncbi:MAG: alcohol dehydrogenase [Halobacteriovoraceae bacterium]|nr:alcohol dehydrogenase [Halobacteriovoraceae bacterium]